MSRSSHSLNHNRVTCWTYWMSTFPLVALQLDGSTHGEPQLIPPNHQLLSCHLGPRSVSRLLTFYGSAFISFFILHQFAIVASLEFLLLSLRFWVCNSILFQALSLNSTNPFLYPDPDLSDIVYQSLPSRSHSFDRPRSLRLCAKVSSASASSFLFSLCF